MLLSWVRTADQWKKACTMSTRHLVDSEPSGTCCKSYMGLIMTASGDILERDCDRQAVDAVLDAWFQWLKDSKHSIAASTLYYTTTQLKAGITKQPWTTMHLWMHRSDKLCRKLWLWSWIMLSNMWNWSAGMKIHRHATNGSKANEPFKSRAMQDYVRPQSKRWPNRKYIPIRTWTFNGNCCSTWAHDEVKHL